MMFGAHGHINDGGAVHVKLMLTNKRMQIQIIV